MSQKTQLIFESTASSAEKHMEAQAPPLATRELAFLGFGKQFGCVFACHREAATETIFLLSTAGATGVHDEAEPTHSTK